MKKIALCILTLTGQALHAMEGVFEKVETNQSSIVLTNEANSEWRESLQSDDEERQKEGRLPKNPLSLANEVSIIKRTLHDAASSGAIEAVKALLKKGIDVNTPNENGETPLHLATFNGHLEVVQELLGAGADRNAEDEDSNIPLYGAIFNGHEKIVEALIDANPETLGNAVLLAAHLGNVDIVNVLLAKGAPLDAFGDKEMTALHHAASQGHADITRLLLEKGAEANAQDSYQSTPLHLAVFRGHAAVVNELLAKNTDINAQNKNGKTPLHLAVEWNRTEIMKKLLAKGANPNIPDELGKTPLHWATDACKQDIVQELLNGGAEANMPDGSSWTPLHCVAAGKSVPEDDVKIIRQLLAKEANINREDNDGVTPLRLAIHLHVPSAHDTTEIARALIFSGAWFSQNDLELIKKQFGKLLVPEKIR